MTDVYRRLAKKLDKLPQGFPATESGVELEILRKIFTPEDAERALMLTPFPETAERLASKLGTTEDDARTILERMALEIARDLEALPPDDQRRVIDLMKRLRGDRGAEEADHVPLGADS